MEALERNLYQRVIGIMAEMGAVGKSGRTAYGERYEYHKIDDIDDKLRQSLVANGVVATIAAIENRVLEHFQEEDKNGKLRTTWYAECTLAIELVNADKPEERFSIHGWGQGIDYSDKASGKAISYAAKSAYLSAFHLRGQPDSESDNIQRGAPAAQQLTPKEQSYVADALKDFALAKTSDALIAIGETIKEKATPPVQNALRGAYLKRQRELKEKENAASDPLL